MTVLEHSPHIARLFVVPNSSAQAYVWQDGWTQEYSLDLSPDERETVKKAIAASVGPEDPRAVILDRGVQVAYAAIGLEASLEEKKAWDPDQSKRKVLKAKLERLLPDFEVLIGGMTSMDITRKGITKAYGVRWLSERLHIAPSDMLYVGDALYEGGNDSVVIPTGIQTRQVSGPAETEVVIDELIKACSA